VRDTLGRDVVTERPACRVLGQSVTFNPLTGFITVVPEPSTYAISAIATAGLASLMRWRKRRTTESEV